MLDIGAGTPAGKTTKKVKVGLVGERELASPKKAQTIEDIELDDFEMGVPKKPSVKATKNRKALDFNAPPEESDETFDRYLQPAILDDPDELD